MKKYKLLAVLVAVLVAAGISLALASGNLQGLISRIKPASSVSTINKSNLQNINSITKPIIQKGDQLKSLYSCNQTKFKTVFILLVEDAKDATTEVVNKVNQLKSETSSAFYEATSHYAQMDTSNPLVIMETDPSMFFDGLKQLTYPEVITKKFYETNKDEFDFIIVSRTFNYTNESPFHSVINRNIEGLGATKAFMSDLYGSNNGYLKALIVLGDINSQNDSQSMPYARVNTILHEIEHQWGVYAGDNFTGAGTGKLEIKIDYMHFYSGLQSPSKTGDPMFAQYWVSNGDGTFRRATEDGYGIYHPIMLYFMGLLPKSEYATKYQIYDGGPGGEKWEKAVPYKKVSVNDIIAVMGERKCK